MMDMDALRREFDAMESWMDYAIRARLKEVGERAVQIAKETGSYHDVTGRLRASNGYSVRGYDLILTNSAPYAEEVESRAIVLSAAAQEAQKMLSE